MPSSDVATFGDELAAALARVLGNDLVGVYFVGSVVLGGYVPGESDIDIVAVSEAALTDPQRTSIAWAVVELSASDLEDAHTADPDRRIERAPSQPAFERPGFARHRRAGGKAPFLRVAASVTARCRPDL